ncbi:MAG: hypothetical protein J6X92_00660, partial [Bacteroidales bacterium]|nr:hypothetical protein [Bacteroidales bacterium]
DDLASILADFSDNTYTIDPEVELDIEIVDNASSKEIAEIEKLEKTVNDTVDGITLDSIDLDSILEFDPKSIDAVEDAGKQVDNGFANGLEENMQGVIDKGILVANTLIEGVCDTLGVESPSKKFIWIGEMVDQGLAIGLQNGISAFGDATRNLTSSIIDDVSEKLGQKKNKNTMADGLAKLFTMPVQQEAIMYGYMDSIKKDIDETENEISDYISKIDINEVLTKAFLGESRYDAFKQLFGLNEDDWQRVGNDIKNVVEGIAEDISNSVSSAFIGIKNNEIVQGIGDLISTIPFVEKLELLKTGLAPKISDFVSNLFDVEEETINMETKTRAEAFKSLAEDILDPIVQFSGDVSIAAFNGIGETISTEYSSLMGRIFEGTELPGAEDIASKIFEVIKTASNTVKNEDDMNTKQVGKKIDEDVAKGIDDTDKKKSLLNVFQKVIESLRTFIAPFVENFKNVGINIDNGIINGLSQNSSLVSQKAREVAMAAYNAACQALGINSPSTAFIWIGEMLGKGLVQGISIYSKNVGNAAAKVAETAVTNAENGVMKLSDVIGFDD